MIDDEDAPHVFTHPAWRCAIRAPPARRTLRWSRRQALSRRCVLLWARAALEPERRPMYRD